MNFTEINHCLTSAINNLAEGEINVAALAMAEDLEREEIAEATKRKNTQKARDRRAFKKYGVKFRSTKSGHTVAINKKGKIAGGNPNVIKDIPAKDKAPSAMNMGTAKPKKKGAASKLRDQLAKAKKAMGKSFNAMLMQSDEETGNLQEESQLITHVNQVGYNIGKYPVVDKASNAITIRVGPKRFTYKWDGKGFARQGEYLYTDKVARLEGGKPVQWKKKYKPGTVIQGGKYNVVIIRFVKHDEEMKTAKYIAKKTKGKKEGTLSISDDSATFEFQPMWKPLALE